MTIVIPDTAKRNAPFFCKINGPAHTAVLELFFEDDPHNDNPIRRVKMQRKNSKVIGTLMSSISQETPIKVGDKIRVRVTMTVYADDKEPDINTRTITVT